MNKKNVCIIGAGIGGLAAGALLSKKGHSVDIFEKEATISGRALSIDMSSQTFESYKDLISRFNMNIAFSEPPLQDIFENRMFQGYTLDLGYHVIGGGVINKVKELLPEYNDDIKIFESRLFEQKNGNYGYFASTVDKIKVLPNVLRLLLSGEKTMRKLDNVTMSETMKKYGKGKTKIFLEVNSRLITTINNLDLISTGEVFRSQKDMRLMGVRYPKNGLLKISQTISDFIIKNGGKIHLNSPVTKIIIEKNKAKGVVVDNKKYFFDAIVSDILVQNLFTIADEKHFPSNYVKDLKTLSGSGSLCAYYSFKNINRDLVGKTFVFIERNAGVNGNDATGMIDFMTALPEVGLAPSSHFLVQAYIICTPEEARNKKTLEKLRKILDKNLEKIIPDYHKNLNWAIYPAIWHLDGVAKTIKNEKPEIKTPIDDFYLIGDCVKAPGIGINCALNSAKLLMDFL